MRAHACLCVHVRPYIQTKHERKKRTFPDSTFRSDVTSYKNTPFTWLLLSSAVFSEGRGSEVAHIQFIDTETVYSEEEGTKGFCE